MTGGLGVEAACGRGGSLCRITHKRRGRVRNRVKKGERVLTALQSNQFVMAVCIWTEIITIWDEGLHLYPGSEWKQWKRERQMGLQRRKHKQMRMDGVTKVRGEDLNVQSIWLYCYNAPGKLVYVWISYCMSHVLCHFKPSFFSRICPFFTYFLLHFTWPSLFSSPLPTLHLFSSSSCPSPSDTWPGVSMRGIL